MIKKLVILLVLALGAGGGVIAYTANNLSSLVNSYRTSIESIVGSSLGVPVQLGAIQTNTFPTTSLVVDETSLGDASTGILSLENLTVRVALWPLLSKRLEVTELLLRNPNITIKKTPDGISIGGHTPKPKTGGAPVPSAPSNRPESPQAGGTSLPISIVLNKVTVEDAHLTFVDDTQGKEVSVSSIDFSAAVALEEKQSVLSGVALSGILMKSGAFAITAPSITYTLDTGTLEAQPISIDFAGNNFVVNVRYETNQKSGESSVSVKSLNLQSVTPVLSEMGIDLSKLPYRISVLSGDIQASLLPEQQTVSSQKIALTLNDKPVHLTFETQITPSEVNAKKLSLEAFGGSVVAPVVLTLGKDAPQFSTPFDLKTISIEDALTTVAPALPIRIFGSLDSAKGLIKGALGAGLLESLNGSTTFTVSKGGIRGTNIAGAALKAANKIPFLSESLYTSTPQQFRSTLDSPDTEFRLLSGTVSLGGGNARLSNVVLDADLYSVAMEGTYGFDGSVNLNATLAFSKEFSQALVSSAADIKKLLSADDTLVIPLSIKGTLPSVLVVPNIEKLIEVAGKRLLKDAAKGALKDALGGKRGVLKGLGSALGF